MRTQQDVIYRAEETLDRGVEFQSANDIDTWVRTNLLDTPWWHERFPRVRGLRVPDVERSGSVGSWDKDTGIGIVEFDRRHMCSLFVCHEIAHVTAMSRGSRAHCPIFARDYLELTFRALGTDPWLNLRQAFIDAEVVF